MSRYLAIIGTAKPELTGATKITDSFEYFAKKNKIKIKNFRYRTYFNQKKYTNLNTFFLSSKFFKFLSFLEINIKLTLSLNNLSTVYIQENGGMGKIYDVYLLILLLVFRKRCYYHNHSSKKLNNYDLLTKIIQFLGRFNVTNIFLSEIEYKKFVRKYGYLNKYYVISNSVFVRETSIKKSQNINSSKKLKIGLLSNLYKDKGLNEFIDLARYGAKYQKAWEFFLAGPIVYNDKLYKKIFNKLDNLNYIGPINDEEQKNKFYKSLDFFIFLTTFINESEPLVILEAISNGCVPIVYDRGSISQLICTKKLIIPKCSNPTIRVVNLIEKILDNKELMNLSFKSFQKFLLLKNNSIKQLEKLTKEIKEFNNI